MLKKLILITNIMLLFGMSILLLVQDHTSITYSEAKFSTIQTTLALSNDFLFNDLYYHNYALSYDTSTNTYYLPLSLQNDEWDVDELNTDASDVSIVFQKNWNTNSKKDSIKHNITYDFIAYNDDYYQTCHLIFTGLPILNLAYTDTASEDTITVSMSLYDPNATSSKLISSDATLRTRGGTSISFPKLGYKLSLTKTNQGVTKNNKQSLLGMRNDDDWILNALYRDPSKLRDKVSLNIWNSFGATNNPFSVSLGSAMEYVECFLNDQYIGLYGLMQPVDEKQIDISVTDSYETSEYLYKKANLSVMYVEDFLIDNQAESRDGVELKSSEVAGSYLDWEAMADFVRLLYEDDESYIETASSLLDTENSIDYWIFVQTIIGTDNINKNYFLASKFVDGERKLFYIPWDLDLTFGNYSTQETALKYDYDSSLITQRLNWIPGNRCLDLNVDGARQKTIERYESLRDTVLSDDELIAMIEEEYQTLVSSGALARDYEKWPDAGWEGSELQLKDTLLQRMQYLDSYISDLKTETE